MTDKDNYEGQVYRQIPVPGKHMADSHGTDGAKRGVYLDDETNQVCGVPEFIPIGEDEMSCGGDSNGENMDADSNELLSGVVMILVSFCAGYLTHKALPYVKKWMKNVAIPWMKKFRAKITKKELGSEETQTETAIEPLELNIDDFSQKVDEVIEEFQNDMTREEVQAHLLNIMCAAIYMASEIRKLDGVVIKKEKWKSTFEKLTTQSMTDEINRILGKNIKMLKDEQVEQISMVFGGAFSSEGDFIPIDNIKFKEALNI